MSISRWSSIEKPAYVEQVCRFDTYLPWHPTTWIILRWISVGRPLGPQDVTCVQRGDPEQRVTTCYSHPGKEMPKFYLASWREDSINLVCKVKNKSSKTWRSKSYSARNPISISMLTSSFQTWSPKNNSRKWSQTAPLLINQAPVEQPPSGPKRIPEERQELPWNGSCWSFCWRISWEIS